MVWNRRASRDRRQLIWIVEKRIFIFSFFFGVNLEYTNTHIDFSKQKAQSILPADVNCSELKENPEKTELILCITNK